MVVDFSTFFHLFPPMPRTRTQTEVVACWCTYCAVVAMVLGWFSGERERAELRVERVRERERERCVWKLRFDGFASGRSCAADFLQVGVGLLGPEIRVEHTQFWRELCHTKKEKKR